MRVKTRAMAAAAVTSLALLAACGGGGAEAPEPQTSEPAGQGGGEIVIRGCTPENPLVPGNTSETCGGDIIDAMAAKLVHYNTETAAPEFDIAENITTDDNQNFTVTLKKGYKFHDGTEVKAKNFVDAWNYTALKTNGQAGAYFYSPIEGYDDVYPSEEDAKPTAETMSGLKVADDYTFTIKTSEKVSNLPVRLGYSAYSPLPDSFFADAKAFEKAPVGAGPFKLDTISTTEYVLTKFADYSGAYKSSIDKLTFRVYTDDQAAYADVVANQLDYTNVIPSDQLVDEVYKDDLPDRNLFREGGRMAAVGFSPYESQLKDNLKLRQAISLAVDRELIAKQIYNGTVTPATGWVSPAVDGFKAGACGEWCTFNAEKAKSLYAESGGYKGTLLLAVNGDGGHGPWAEAACNSIKNTLGLDCRANILPDFDQYNAYVDAGDWKGMIRQGWQMDYPSIENFLAPIYAKGADSNHAKYDNPEFEAKLAEAAAAETADEANALYQEAELMLAEDLPTMPMWYPGTVVGFSDKVTNVKINAFGRLDFTAIQVK